jgi:hypothetical protein
MSFPKIHTTPRTISGAVKRFLRTLKSVGNPVFLPFTETSTDYRAGYCHSNCEAEHRRLGVPVVFGWMIWEVENAPFMEAEFHCVIRRGRHLKDITPRRDGEILILFVPDNQRVAVRFDDRTWETWSNQKLSLSSLGPTQKILLRDPSGSNVWPDP